MAIATTFGDTAIINNVVDDFRAEALARAMAVVSKNTVGVTDYVTTGKTIQGNVIPNALSYAMKIGRDLRESNEQGLDAALNITSNNKGKILFRGKVERYNWDTIDGFTIGDVYLDGLHEYKNHKYHVWFKNENIVSYLDDKIDVSVPDLICILDTDNNPITNPNYEVGKDVVVYALPAPDEWTTKRGLEVFGPRSFKFNFDYKPFNR